MSLLSGNLFAAEWTRSAGVTTSAVYTDNVGLDGGSEESDLIPTIAPHWSIKGKGAGATFEMIGSSELKDVGGGNQTNNLSYQTNADAELIERIFFVDATATATQNAINPLSKSGSDNLSESSGTNTTTTYAVKISPYVKGRIKRFANFEARYNYSYVTSDEIDDGDTRSGQLAVSLNSGNEFGKLTWGVNGSQRTTNSQSGSSSDNSSLTTNLGYQLNRVWRVTGRFGKEWTDFTSDGDTGGINWELGAVWTPSPRTSLDVGYGRRYSGTSGHLDFSHRSRRSVITASYSQEITDTHGLLSNQVIYDPLDPFGEPPIHFTGDMILLSDGTILRPITDNAQFLNDRFSLSYTLKGKRTTLSVDGDYSMQTSQDASESSSYGVGVRVDRTLSGLLSADAGLSWDTQKQADDSETDLWRLNLGLNQKLGKKTSLRLNYIHTKRESDQVGDSYDENKVTLSLTHSIF
ncbi:MAG: TIGR03016 family PEP-CTERM system-associated outer membrane protein [Gammaproteobacteria bacterium]|nr:TIGR03016 family PEP-CTERM system-associated outer membrane protein [Gammaproteobacteria bacterium]